MIPGHVYCGLQSGLISQNVSNIIFILILLVELFHRGIDYTVHTVALITHGGTDYTRWY